MSEHRRFEGLVLPPFDTGYNQVRCLTRDVKDAEGVVQDACLRALKYIGAVCGSDVQAWFPSIARNAFYGWCVRNRPAEIAADDGTASTWPQTI